MRLYGETTTVTERTDGWKMSGGDDGSKNYDRNNKCEVFKHTTSSYTSSNINRIIRIVLTRILPGFLLSTRLLSSLPPAILPSLTNHLCVLRRGTVMQTVMQTVLQFAHAVVNPLVDLKKYLAGDKTDVLIITLITALTAPLSRFLRISPIISYLLSGTLIGPSSLHLISGVNTVSHLAELGIVFFLFEMGLELSVDRLTSMKKDVFGLGLAQYAFTTAVTACILNHVPFFNHLSLPARIVTGLATSLSSSAFVLQLLKTQNNLGTRYGKASFSILLLQDLAIVPVLVLIPLLASNGAGIKSALIASGINVLMALTTIGIAGRYLLNKLFNVVAKAKNQEAFLCVTMLTVLSMSFLTEGLGLSNTLGAFLAGVLLSETKYRYQIEADIAPFRGVLLGLFFITVGFEIDMSVVLRHAGIIFGSVAGLVALKSAITAALALIFGLSLANAIQTGMLLSQGGEFAFVAFGLAKSFKLIDPATTKIFMTTVALSMATTPALAALGGKIAKRLERRAGSDHYLGQDKEAKEIQVSKDFVIVVGYGTVGKMVCDLMDKKFQRFIGIENDTKRAIQARNKGLPIFYGDVTRSEVNDAFHIGDAKAVILTIENIRETNRAVLTLRRQYPDLPIFARAADADHQRRLQNTLKVNAMVPINPTDSVLLTLPFGGAVLKSLGVSSEEVDGILAAKRNEIQNKVVIDASSSSSLETVTEAGNHETTATEKVSKGNVELAEEERRKETEAAVAAAAEAVTAALAAKADKARRIADKSAAVDNEKTN
jgi:monovalent cation:proton antiporter-2 (CPA2) family protein